MAFKTLELQDYQINLVIKVLREKRDELDIVLKNPDGLEDDTIHDLQLEHRDINDIMREMQFYAVIKEKAT